MLQLEHSIIIISSKVTNSLFMKNRTSNTFVLFIALLAWNLNIIAQDSVSSKSANVSDNDVPNILLYYLSNLETLFRNSKIIFKYSVQPGSNGIEYFQARAFLRALASSKKPNEQAIDKEAIKGWATRDYQVEAVFSGEQYDVKIKETRHNGRVIEGEYRFDGNRFLMSTNPNRWDIVSSDFTPVTGPAALLNYLPNAIGAVPLSASIANVSNDERFLKRLEGAIRQRTYYELDKSNKLEKKIRFLLPDPVKVNKTIYYDVIDCKFSLKRGPKVEEVNAFRIDASNYANFKSFRPSPLAVQTIYFSNFVKAKNGMFVPKHFSVTYSVSWASLIKDVPDARKLQLATLTGISDKNAILNALIHKWEIEDIQTEMQLSKAVFSLPENPDIVVYDYITDTFLRSDTKSQRDEDKK